MTDLLSSIRPEPPIDQRYGRYKLADPETGKLRTWTRATTFAGAVEDQFGLTAWKLRMAVKGIGLRKDLYALAASAGIDDKTTLDTIAESAMETAGAAEGRNQGSALHKMTETIDSGGTVNAPPPWGADIEAYETALAHNRIAVIPEYVERVVCLPELGVAGTLDRLVKVPGHKKLIVADLKTSKNADFIWLKAAAQLALYAHATHMWEGKDQWSPMPEVSWEHALVIHLPVGKATCDLYWIDLMAGWEIVELCSRVRGARASAKKLSTAFNSKKQEDPRLVPIRDASSIADLACVYKKMIKEGELPKTIENAIKHRMLELKNDKGK